MKPAFLEMSRAFGFFSLFIDFFFFDILIMSHSLI